MGSSAQLPQWQQRAVTPKQPDVPAMSLDEACFRTLETRENVIPAVRSAHASAEGKQILRQLQKCKGHEPAGRSHKSKVNEDLLGELSCLYPEASKELLRNAAGCSRLEDAIDMVTECLSAGVAAPPPKQDAPQVVPSVFQWPTPPAADHADCRPRIPPTPTTILTSPATKTEAVTYEDRYTRTIPAAAVKTNTIESVHTYKVATMSSPTWCADCGSFLWGVSSQGLTCQWCQSTVCKPCAHKGSSQPCNGRALSI